MFKNRLLLLSATLLTLSAPVLAVEPKIGDCPKITVLAQNQSAVPLSTTITINGQPVKKSVGPSETSTFAYHPPRANPWTVKGMDVLQTPPVYSGNCQITVPSVQGCVDPTKNGIQMMMNTMPGPNGATIPTCTLNVVPL